MSKIQSRRRERFVSRRGFLRRAGAAAAGAIAGPTFAARNILGASDRIVMGCIGCGGMGTGDMNALKSTGAVEYAAVCDVYAPHRERNAAMNGPSCQSYLDFRDVLDRRDIDAVNCGTPDHWHGLIAIAACQAGKDIYCQKPLSLTIEQGRAMVTAARRYNRVFQTGSQQRSESNFRYACELVRNGRIGKLLSIRTSVGGNKLIDWEPDTDPPEGLDWDFYLGPAPRVPFNRRRFIWDFRWFYDYSGGNLTDWGAHHNDIAQWGLGMDGSGPIEIDGRGMFPQHGMMDTPLTYEVKYRYSSGVELVCDSSGNGVWFHGSEGEVYVNRGQLASKPAEIIQEPTRADEIHLYESSNHYQNFVDCVRSRKTPVCDVETGHRSVTVCHLGNISIRLGRPIRWDPGAEEVIGDEEANRWRSRPMRAPWHL
ncbi:MAG: Gfo/Idh/MocA family oxidoreductase [Planctomycetes bacterium]|nr:Gfo/Idh/MocA family oxidoreductase [Planctomycetota bacterium]